MQIHHLPFSKVPQFSNRDIAYTTGDAALRPFYEHEVSIETFPKVIEQRKKLAVTDRNLLVEVLKEQYERFETSEATAAHIEALAKENTWTITTAHQPSLMTGPLYYPIKILSTIKLCRDLQEAYPDQHFVPVFVTGGEDHDFEEINHFYLFNKKLVWENNESGAVGNMSTASLAPLLQELKDILGDREEAQQLYHMIQTAYTKHDRYIDAAIHLTNALFGKYGLVILSMNHPRLKEKFATIIEKEILEQTSQQLVQESQEALAEAGFGAQAYAREINFFYLDDQVRERIVQEGDHYQVLNTDKRFTKEEIRQEIQERPAHFSPNVVTRPLFQELILPNLAYVGGGGELAYWLERRSQFAEFGLPYPMLIRRDSVLWIDSGTAKRMAKVGLSWEDIFRPTERLVQAYVRKHTQNEISLSEEKAALKKLLDEVVEKARGIDKTLIKAAKGEQAKMLNGLDQLEGKLMRAEKNSHETAIGQIKSVRDKLFPDNGLQERKENVLNFYLRYGDDFFETLLAHLDALRGELLIVMDAAK